MMTYIKNYRYQLKTYHRSKDKPTCPACGKKHRFSEYIDMRNGKPVGEGVGKCDRINSCGYWVTPHEYFKQHPEARSLNSLQSLYTPKTVEPPRLFLPQDVIEQYGAECGNTNFGIWLAGKAPSEEILVASVKMYRLTATTTKAIIFWYIDYNGRFCQGKMMWYNANGHRNGFVNTVSSDLSKKGILPANPQMHRCLFGEHLLKERPEAIVYLVEGEKTAIVMSMLKPQFLWLATGGCGMLNTHIVKPLRGRRVVVVPDSGCLEK